MGKAVGVREASRRLRKQEDRKSGIIVEIRRDWDDHQKARVEVELPTPRRKKRKNLEVVSDVRRETVVVDMGYAQMLKLGDELEIKSTVKR